MIFDLVVGPAREGQRDFLPVRSVYLLEGEQATDLLVGPGALAEVGAQMVDPPLPALLGGFDDPGLCQEIRYFVPVGRKPRFLDGQVV